MKLISAMLLGVFCLLSGYSSGEEQPVKVYCDLPPQSTATGEMIKPYPVIYLDLFGDRNPDVLVSISTCMESPAYYIVKAPRSMCEFDDDGFIEGCYFVFDDYEREATLVKINTEGSEYRPNIVYLPFMDDGGWTYKIQTCPRSNEIVATGFYRLLERRESGMNSYVSKKPNLVPVRAEATWDAVGSGDSCFGAGEMEFTQTP